MARKRMLDPNFWTDLRIRKLSPVERLFFLGCVSAADDEGRLIGDPAFLRSEIFRYDDITTEDIEAIRDHVAEVLPGFVVYKDDGETYIAFANWSDYQKPSYAKPSVHPRPPFVPHSSEKDEEGTRSSSLIRPQVSIGKISIGKDSIGSRPSDSGFLFSSEWQSILIELQNLHDRAAVLQDWTKKTGIVRVTNTEIVIQVPKHDLMTFERVYKAKLAQAIGLACPDWAEREVILLGEEK